jgi:hypothetical protein
LEAENVNFCNVFKKISSSLAALISLILKELSVKKGTVEHFGSIAYVPQEPCMRFEFINFFVLTLKSGIQSGTIRDNILFGKEMKRRIYDQVLFACALSEDLKILPGGEDCEIGERGVRATLLYFLNFLD